ncbi:MAG: type II toxin-antitoxin system VapC family toxin [Bacteroidota bacterium]
MVLCDTNILIHAFNGNSETLAQLESIGFENIVLSSITIMELYQGMGNKEELARMKSRIKYFDSVEVNENISKHAQGLIEGFSLSHGLSIPDAIIGSTAVIHEIELFTYNLKDFRFIPNIKLYQLV